MKDILLVGFGAVGAVYSLILKRSGLARVTVVARSNFEIVSNDGVHFKSRKYGEITGWRPDRLCRSVSEAADRHYSYVFVTTKAIPEVAKTPKLLESFLSPPYTNLYPQPTYVLLQNGLNVEVDLYDVLKGFGKEEPSIISTAVWIGTNLLGPNVVEHNHFDRVQMGVYRHKDFTTTTNTPEEAALLQDLGNILEKGGSTVTIFPEIQRVKFSKNLWNIVFASYATLTGYTLPAIFRSPPGNGDASYEPYVSPTTAEMIETYSVSNIRAALLELIKLGRALGFPDTEDGLPLSIVENTIENTRALHVKPDSTHTPSMLLDLQKGQPIEVEAVVGEVVRMAQEYNVDIPRVETLYGLLLIIQNQILRKREESRL